MSQGPLAFKLFKNDGVTCAKITAKQTWRRRVDFPPILGPVMRMKLACLDPPIFTSFGTKEPLPNESPLRTGCPRPVADKCGTSTDLELDITGRHLTPS